MLKKMLKNQVRLQIEGVNIKRLIKTLIKNEIEIYDLSQSSYKQIEITIKAEKFKKIIPFLKEYRFKVIKNYGLSYLKSFSIMHLGVVVGVILFFIALFFNSNFLSKIYIYGNERIENNEIISFLNTKNIKTNTFFTSYEFDKLETELENNFTDISFCSIIKKGTNLIINIKEKLYADEILETSNLISQFNGQIISIDCKQGTPLVKNGDSVKVGDILIAGYIENNGINVNCKAIGEIKMKVWYTSSFEFFNEKIEKVRTGRIFTNSYYKIFNNKFKIKEYKNTFGNYEKETFETYLFKNIILPIKIYKEKFYEIQENLVKNDFSSEKDAIIDKTMNNALSLVPNNLEVVNSFTEISDTETGKIVTSYVETIQSFS